MQVVYELFLKFVMSPYLQPEVVVRCISKSFIKRYIELFDSEDPRERDYLKTILHRVYGKFMSMRTMIKELIMHTLLRITHDQDKHNGLTELLELLVSISNGFQVPLKLEHQQFFKQVLVPLFKVKELATFST